MTRYLIFLIILAGCQKYTPDPLGKDGWIGTYHLKRVIQNETGSEIKYFEITNQPRCTIPENEIMNRRLPGMVYSNRIVIYSAHEIGFEGAYIEPLDDEKDSVSMRYSVMLNGVKHKFKATYSKN